MTIETDYVRHALTILRVANGLRQDANLKIRNMARRIKKIFAEENLAELNFSALKKLILEADDLAAKVFGEISGAQSSAVADLIEIEAQWAAQTGNYTRAASETAIQKSIRSFTTLGQTIEEQLNSAYDRFRLGMVSNVRLGASSNQTDSEIIQRLVGTGPQFEGGLFQRTLADVNAIVEGQATAAADNGRRLVQSVNGINALKFHAVLDSRVCPSCGVRDGMFYTVAGEPINHDVPYLPIPLHNWCRCIYIPQDIPTGMEAKIKPSSTFDKFLDDLTQEQQDEILGVGRAELWRDGKITLNDLVGQNGMVMSLQELRNSL